jgi:MOSC domain-containing protein YiiM
MPSGKRHVTLIQAEHLPVIAALTGHGAIDPALLRRNVVVSGINLVALRSIRFAIGDEVVLEGTGPCEPCAKMDVALGDGGFQAMRGHGGITARVIAGGVITLGAAVRSADASRS